jgi:hypothetical protein
MTPLHHAWRAGLVRRWHANPDMADTQDTVHRHQGGVASLAMLLWPTAHGVHRAAIIHDLGEVAVGDIPGPIKEQNPDFAEIASRLEAEARKAMGVPDVDLSSWDKWALELVDRLDAYLWTHAKNPQLLDRPDWQEARKAIGNLAWKTGAQAEVAALFRGME